jgi:hypothetical protein
VVGQQVDRHQPDLGEDGRVHVGLRAKRAGHELQEHPDPALGVEVQARLLPARHGVDRPRVGPHRLARPGAAQHDPVDEVRAFQRGVERDPRPHRQSDERDRPGVEVLQQRGEVGVRPVALRAGRRRRAVPAGVRHHDPVPGGQRPDLTRPHPSVDGTPVQQHQRRAPVRVRAGVAVGDPAVLHGQERRDGDLGEGERHDNQGVIIRAP